MTATADQLRRCPQCGKRREADSFLSNGPRARCALCRVRINQERREMRYRIGPSIARASHLWSKYRLRPADYDALRSAQQYRCAICRTHEDDLKAKRGGRRRTDGQPAAEAFRLVVDHCHATGRVRGLLCNECNTALGYLKENPELFLAAIDYIAEHQASEVQP
jgi:hypothetical protein